MNISFETRPNHIFIPLLRFDMNFFFGIMWSKDSQKILQNSIFKTGYILTSQIGYKLEVQKKLILL